eukprot:CAMPEP_0175165812 /NCGR_PEP_ID=MMETSP0087-20121206/27315_1 /TAXON_ID=136419 /ORGANISM="Unknown Unknown, Strain D1" /LENGTH=126 /DNA_ID=CAMNT_0016455273 /DNA_START=108 /DNA_END=489 /DNA_ORIENTATION=-
MAASLTQLQEQKISGSSFTDGTGIDVEDLASFEKHAHNPNFLERNFNDVELAYCRQSSKGFVACLAGKWCAKEAVIKAISSAGDASSQSNLWQSPSSPLKDICIVPSPSGAPAVLLSGYAMKEANG